MFYVNQSDSCLHLSVTINLQIRVKLYTGTYLSRPFYKTCIIFFPSRLFSSVMIKVHYVLQLFCQAVHKDIHFKTNIGKRDSATKEKKYVYQNEILTNLKK